MWNRLLEHISNLDFDLRQQRTFKYSNELYLLDRYHNTRIVLEKHHTQDVNDRELLSVRRIFRSDFPFPVNSIHQDPLTNGLFIYALEKGFMKNNKLTIL